MPFSTVCSLLRVPYEDLASALTEDVLTARGRQKITIIMALDRVLHLSKLVGLNLIFMVKAYQ